MIPEPFVWKIWRNWDHCYPLAQSSWSSTISCCNSHETHVLLYLDGPKLFNLQSRVDRSGDRGVSGLKKWGWEMEKRKMNMYMSFRNFYMAARNLKWPQNRRQMNVQLCLLLETKMFEFMVREEWREDGKVCLVIPFSFPSFLTPLLEDIYLIVDFTLPGTSFPFCHFVKHANSLPLLSFCPEKIQWMHKDLLVLKKIKVQTQVCGGVYLLLFLCRPLCSRRQL